MNAPISESSVYASPAHTRSTLRSLETLRFFAAVAVVLSHFYMVDVPILNAFLGSKVFVGSIGVDIFFVVSGYVMYLSAAAARPGPQGAVDFLVGRALRIFPLYILATLLFVMLPTSITHVEFDLNYLVKSLLLVPDYRDPIIYLGWTLRFELFFYLLVALGIALNKHMATPTLGLLAAVVMGVFLNFYFGATIVLEFLTGYFMAYYLGTRPPGGTNALGLKIGLALSGLLLLLAATGRDFGSFPDWVAEITPTHRMWITHEHTGLLLPRVLAWGVPATLFVYFAVRLEAHMKWRFAGLGKYTYSLYLLQPFMLLVAAEAALVAPGVVVVVMGFAVLGVASYLSYRYFEAPVLKLRKPLRRLLGMPSRALARSRSN